jgi:hypothetical protein
MYVLIVAVMLIGTVLARSAELGMISLALVITMRSSYQSPLPGGWRLWVMGLAASWCLRSGLSLWL